jgi:hypothetical protein
MYIPVTRLSLELILLPKRRWYTWGIMALRSASAQTGRRMSTPAFIVLVVAVCAVAIGTGIFVGKSDSGAINVSAAIQSANQANIAAGGSPSENVDTPGEEFHNMPNGGLVPQNGDAPAPPPPPPPEVDGAATTTENASTTAESTTTDTAPITGDGATPNAGQ